MPLEAAAAAVASSGASQESGSEWWKLGHIPVMFQATNPKREWTKAYERYSKYYTARTVQAARDLGATTADLRGDWDSGFLSIPGDVLRTDGDDSKMRAAEAQLDPPVSLNEVERIV